MPSTSHRVLLFVGAASLGLVLGACFNGLEAEGLPCTADSQCGTSFECIDGYCGGTFRCSDGSQVALTALCDGTSDCEESTDEAPELCGLYDLCAGSEVVFEYGDGPSSPGASNPIGVFTSDFVGDDRPDVLIAGRGASFVRIYELPIGSAPVEHNLAGDNDSDPYFTSAIQDVVIYDVDSDDDDDIVVLTADERVFGFINEGADSPPAKIGDPVDVPGLNLGELGSFVDIAAGEFSQAEQPWAEFVVLTENGVIVSAQGDGEAALLGVQPFEFESLHMIEGESFTTVALQDLDGDMVDELLVTGMAAEGPRLWIRTRAPGDVGWVELAEFDPGFPVDELAFGRFDDDPTLDMALLGRTGRVEIRRNTGPGMYTSAGRLEELGPISGLVARDFDCSGPDDLIFASESAAAVQAYLVREMGGLDPLYAVSIDTIGRPAGKVALAQLNPGNSWDVVVALEAGGSLASPEFRVFLSGGGEGP